MNIDFSRLLSPILGELPVAMQVQKTHRLLTRGYGKPVLLMAVTDNGLQIAGSNSASELPAPEMIRQGVLCLADIADTLDDGEDTDVDHREDLEHCALRADERTAESPSVKLTVYLIFALFILIVLAAGVVMF